ncbi:MFS superfamily [Mycena kentingensis (nom. inval.)]|nr:MFS superfamily [Mycena kentingensis (nom. inval.)]
MSPSAPPSPAGLDAGPDAPLPAAPLTHDFGFVPIPERLQYREGRRFHLGWALYLILGFSSTFTVTNLYWCQPLLIELAGDFNVSYSKISEVPTLLQAGYALGVVFITPLGDVVRRRQLILACLVASTALTVGLAVTHDFVAFEVLSFLVAFASVVTTILQPLVADMAPPHRRAMALSIVISGLLLGVLVARVLSGILGQFSSWRGAYLIGVGTQAAAILANYVMLPDYPSRNTSLSYPRILWTMAKFAVTEPALIQPCLINFCTSAAFTSFWVTLTFLLGGPLYNYNTLEIGLFGLVGMAGVLLGPIMGRFIDLLVPWYSTLLAICALAIFNVIQAAAGGLSIGAIVVVAFGVNLFRQWLQASLATTVLGISPEARSRLNAVNVLSIFLGQVTGTAAGTNIYLAHGWRLCAVFSVGLCVAQLVILGARGPQCARYTWVGWEGGWGRVRAPRRKVPAEGEREARESDLEKAGVIESREGSETARNAPPQS